MRVHAILMPTDLSDESLVALDPAVSLAKSFSARLHVVHVLEDLPGFPVVSYERLPTFTPDDFYRETETRVRERLQRLVAERIPPEVRGEIFVQRGSPILEITHLAKQQRIDLIVMSTHGRTGIGHALLGSMTEKVLRNAPCAVLTVRAQRP